MKRTKFGEVAMLRLLDCNMLVLTRRVHLGKIIIDAHSLSEWRS